MVVEVTGKQTLDSVNIEVFSLVKRLHEKDLIIFMIITNNILVVSQFVDRPHVHLQLFPDYLKLSIVLEHVSGLMFQ